MLIFVRGDNHLSDTACDECGWYKYYLELCLCYFLWHLWLFSRMVLCYVGTWLNVQTNQYFYRLIAINAVITLLVCWMWYYCITLYFEVKSWLSCIEVSHIFVRMSFKKDTCNYHKINTPRNATKMTVYDNEYATVFFSRGQSRETQLRMNVRPSHLCRTITRCFANECILNVQVTWSVHRGIWYHN